MPVHLKVGIALCAVSFLTLGCSASTGGAEKKPAAIGIPNPASQYCVSKGGKVEIKKDAAGHQTGVCHLPDGTRIDEWELFRRDNAPAGK